MGLQRSTYYYLPTPVWEPTLRTMTAMNALYPEDPCSSRYRIVGYLAKDENPISRDVLLHIKRRIGC